MYLNLFFVYHAWYQSQSKAKGERMGSADFWHRAADVGAALGGIAAFLALMWAVLRAVFPDLYSAIVTRPWAIALLSAIPSSVITVFLILLFFDHNEHPLKLCSVIFAHTKNAADARDTIIFPSSATQADCRAWAHDAGWLSLNTNNRWQIGCLSGQEKPVWSWAVPEVDFSQEAMTLPRPNSCHWE